jgi:GAF domain-containing protein
VEVTGCAGGSVQLADEERNGLRLVASRGLHPASAAFWDFVGSGSSSVCGMALAAGSRAVVEDVEAEFADAASLGEFRRSELRAVQSTPLATDDGRLVGMLSTYWRVPHEPSPEELRLLDVLARFADLERLAVRCSCSRSTKTFVQRRAGWRAQPTTSRHGTSCASAATPTARPGSV